MMKPRHLLLLPALAIAAPLSAQPVAFPFFDGDLPDAQWNISTVTFGNGGTTASVLLAASGNPDACRRIDIQLNNAASGQRSGAMSVHIDTTAVYDPATEEPIGLVCFSVWGNDGAKGDLPRARVSPAVRQGGAVYITRLGVEFDENVIDGWTFFSDVNTPDQFVEIDPSDAIDGLDLTSQPDFSSSGAPMELGFVVRNNTGLNGAGFTRSVRVDNWQLTLIARDCVGDLNGDGVVNAADLAIILAGWGGCP